MVYEDLPRGRARIASHVPTLPALRYLNCCTMVGWHHCNELYHQSYQVGISKLFLLYTVDGVGKMEMDGKTYTLCKDSVVLVPPHTPMRYATDAQCGKWEFYWLDLTGDRVLSLAADLCRDGHCFSHVGISLERRFTELLRENVTETERSALVGRILDAIVADAVFGAKQAEPTVDLVLRYMAEHCCERLELDTVSRRFYLSQNQIIRIVRARTGYTPHEYLVRLRLAKACELLQCTAQSVGEVGRAVGYENSSHFCAAFRRLLGITPTEYRARFSR